jgi:hypothetical protein
MGNGPRNEAGRDAARLYAAIARIVSAVASLVRSIKG